MAKTEKKNDIRTAAVIALCGNAVLAALKIAAGIFSESGALLSDGIDSSADMLFGVVTLIVVRIISKPADMEHPWGHGRAETVTTAFLSFLLFFTGGQLVISTVTKLFSGEQASPPSAFAIVVSLVSIAGLIGLWIIKTAVGVFLEVNLELMDGSTNTEPYQIIADAVNSVDGAGNPHRARMRRIARFWDIDVDIDVDPECTVSKAHEIATRVEDEIKSRLENVYDIMIHIEPQGDDTAETFGLSENMMRRK